MRTAGAECNSNQVDAEAALRFTLRTIKQFLDVHGRREKLKQKLLERAQREIQEPKIDLRALELTRLQSRQTELRSQRETIEYRMARERTDILYLGLTRQYQVVLADLSKVEEEIRQKQAEQTTVTSRRPEAQADAAMGLLDDVARITSDSTARAEINGLLKRLGLWLGLKFQTVVKGKKREVQQLVSGMMVIGGGRLPVQLFGRHNCDLQDARSRESVQTASITRSDEEGRTEMRPAGGEILPAPVGDLGDQASNRPNNSQPEGISITKGSRGKRI
jgi:hypothetical protein